MKYLYQNTIITISMKVYEGVNKLNMNLIQLMRLVKILIGF